MFHSLAGYLGTVYTTVKKTKVLFYSTAAAAICNIVLNLILVKLLGTMGAAVATLLSYFTAFIIRRIDVKKYIKIKTNTVKYIAEISILFLEIFVMLYDVKYSFAVSFGIFILLCIMNMGFFKDAIEMCKSFMKKS